MTTDPPCKCSHAASLHSRLTYHGKLSCWSTACGCQVYRPAVSSTRLIDYCLSCRGTGADQDGDDCLWCHGTGLEP
jgi:hypothetical protein